jgi:serine/threonine-protein kinase
MNQNQPLIGEKLGSYRIESVIGSGAMGVVYRGTNEKNGRIAAVKVVNTEYAQGSKIRDRFDREAEILQQFRHPSIVRFLAVGRYRGTSYIAMEFIEGVTLEAQITERGNIPWRKVVDLGIQICEALQYAHERGVVHRDLKPSNLMITADGKIKLTDFGIAKDLDATALTATDRTLGTAAYMSPEQIRGRPPVSHKTDLYALGIVFYQMLTGKPPFEGGTPVVLMHSHLNEPPPRPSTKIHEIPKVLDELIVNLMAKAPADRPFDAEAVRANLTELRDKAERGAPIGMVFPSAQSRSGKPSRAVAANSSAAASSAEPSRKKSRKTGAGANSPGRDGTGSGERFAWLNRSSLETGLLVLALLLIGGFIVYWVYPPSAGYLYGQAETLMASTRRGDWQTALEEYLNPLDKRFPKHPYGEQTRKWRDKILLYDAEKRAGVLASGLDISMARAADSAESQFQITNKLAQDASKRGDDQAAIRQWQGMADQFQSDPDDRQWHLLALNRVAQLESGMKDRRQYVERQWALAESARLAGRYEDADTIKRALKEQYSRYIDLSDFFASTLKDAGADSGADKKMTAAPIPSPADKAESDSPDPSPAASPRKSTDPDSDRERSQEAGRDPGF